MLNRYDAFSHSIQCDDFLSVISDILAGVAHTGCKCWCHTRLGLLEDPNAEYDPLPEEYLTSADRAFLDVPASSLPSPVDVPGTTFKDDAGMIFEPLKYGQRSAREIANGKCDTCGDTLKDCECVE